MVKYAPDRSCRCASRQLIVQWVKALPTLRRHGALSLRASLIAKGFDFNQVDFVSPDQHGNVFECLFA